MRKHSSSATAQHPSPRRNTRKTRDADAPAEAQPPAPLPPAPPETPGEGIVAVKRQEPDAAVPRQRILVVDDSADTRNTLKTMLELAVHVDVDTVGDGALALEALKERPYSVVITDLKMPRVSGMQL